jgi:hypothetical protein
VGGYEALLASIDHGADSQYCGFPWVIASAPSKLHAEAQRSGSASAGRCPAAFCPDLHSSQHPDATGAHSVQPVAMSVSVKVCTKPPFAVGPLVCHEVCFDEPRRRIVPAIEGSHRYAAPDRRRRRTWREAYGPMCVEEGQPSRWRECLVINALRPEPDWRKITHCRNSN